VRSASSIVIRNQANGFTGEVFGEFVLPPASATAAGGTKKAPFSQFIAITLTFHDEHHCFVVEFVESVWDQGDQQLSLIVGDPGSPAAVAIWPILGKGLFSRFGIVKARNAIEGFSELVGVSVVGNGLRTAHAIFE
jgi:hypothetical protein